MMGALDPIRSLLRASQAPENPQCRGDRPQPTLEPPRHAKPSVYEKCGLATFSEFVVYLLLLIILVKLGGITPRTAALAQVTSVGAVLPPIGILVIAAWCQRAAWKRCSVRDVISYSTKAAPNISAVSGSRLSLTSMPS
ncbi:MAG: hypothetical protein JO189_13665, partial [Deltaproteobacteria bacterium]|nr:hypothetical protein [Deltaproteobacteria bacterium]